MYLFNPFNLRNNWGHQWSLECSSSRNYIRSFNHSIASFNNKPSTFIFSPYRSHIYALTNWRIKHLGIINKIIGNFFLWNKGILMLALELHIRKTIVPCRTVCNKRIPAHCSPMFRSSCSFQNDMFDTSPCEVLACCDTRLTSTYYDNICFFQCH